jgi:hypothetical protein
MYTDALDSLVTLALSALGAALIAVLLTLTGGFLTVLAVASALPPVQKVGPRLHGRGLLRATSQPGPSACCRPDAGSRGFLPSLCGRWRWRRARPVVGCRSQHDIAWLCTAAIHARWCKQHIAALARNCAFLHRAGAPYALCSLHPKAPGCAAAHCLSVPTHAILASSQDFWPACVTLQAALAAGCGVCARGRDGGGPAD